MSLSIELIALLAAVAAIAGFIDAIAGGGGLLTLPALLAAGVPPVAAVATNKLQSTFGTGGACLAFARKGHLDLARFRGPAAAAFVGSALGAFVLQRVDPAFLAGLIPILLLLMAIYFLLSPRIGEADRQRRIGMAALAMIVGAIGFYDGFFGPGAGAFYATVLLALFGLGLVRATAHTKLLNFASNLAGLGVLIAGGHVLWIVGLAMAAGSIVGGQLGSHAAMRFGGRVIKPLLVVMSLALTAKMLADPANPLGAALFGR